MPFFSLKHHLSALLLLCFVSINAQTTSFVYQQMDSRNGLSNSSINRVFQDRDQLVWVGTWDGLNMFNGNDFRVFNYNSQEKGSIGNNVIIDIDEDKEGNIWMNTIGGISCFKKATGEFKRYFYAQTNNQISEREFELSINKKGEVFCYSKDGGLSIFNKQTQLFEAIRLPKGTTSMVKMEFRKDLLWMLGEDGKLYAFRVNGGSATPVRTIQLSEKISNFFAVEADLFLIGKTDLYKLNRHFQAAPSLLNMAASIKNIALYKGHYLISWDTQGISVFDSLFNASDFMSREAQLLSNVKITSINPVKNDVLWIGTDGNGLIKIFPRINHFKLVGRATGYDLGKPVRAFCNLDKDLLIGTKGKGIIRLKNWAAEGKEIKYQEFLNTNKGLSNNSIFTLKKRNNDYIYIGTDGPGLSVYDTKLNKLFNWQSILQHQKSPIFRSVYAILVNEDQSLWLGTSGYGLLHLKIVRNQQGLPELQFSKQYLSSKHPGLANDIIYALASEQQNKLWIACRYGGLSSLDLRTNTFKTYKSSAQNNGLTNNDVLSLLIDKQKNLWIGTSYGLNFLSFSESQKQEPVFRKYTMDQGLPNNTIHALAEGAKGDIWLSTNKGLAKINRKNFAIANFRESDGLQSNEFSDGAVWKSPEGELYFGGIYGFNYFKPENIVSNTFQPNIFVSSLQLGSTVLDQNQVHVLKDKGGVAPHYILERKDNYFRLELESMSYLNPGKNEFTFMLKGLDQAWNYSGAIGKMSYNNIPPGKYTMLVKWSNGEGIWTDPVPVFTLQVKQYFWLTYPALAIYLIALGLLGYLFHTYRKNKVEMRFKLEMEHLLREKDKATHLNKLNFFTNIAHEIQTPLTMIMASVEHLLMKGKDQLFKQPANHYSLNLVYQHTVRLIYLMQQLLEFRKAEAGYLKKESTYVDLTKMLENLFLLFQTENEKFNRNTQYDIGKNMAGFVDKDKLEKILFNLLSNAFKYSEKQDTVRFEAKMDTAKGLLLIKVSNSGCHLQQGDMDRIFDKFYTENSNTSHKFGTGIGLAFTRELVNLLGASISHSLHGDWISFDLQVPIQSAPEAGIEEKVSTSAPSMSLHPLIQSFDGPEAEEANKNTLIEDLNHPDRQRILLVEDEPELRYLLRNILSDQYTIYEANNGAEALEIVNKTTPDLIISDVMMPVMDGFRLCYEIKNTPATAQIPFILLSAKANIENQTEGYEIGADAYVPKPFHINHLLVRVKKLLEYQQKMKDLLKDQNINNQFADTDITDADKQFLENLLKIISENMSEPELNAAFLEDRLSISKMQLYRKLKSLSGMTPAEFIKRIRLKHAADLLEQTKLTVAEIFYSTGFNNQSYFFREFKKRYQCAPNEYRTQLKTLKEDA